MKNNKEENVKNKKVIEIIIFVAIMVVIIGGVVLAVTLKETKNESEANLTTVSTIKLTDNTFVRKLDDIQTNYKKYENKEITYEGFIYIQNGTFMVARMYNCCGTDSYLMGLECKYDGQTPNVNEWVKVTGTLAIGKDETTNEEYPYINVTNLEVMQERGNDRVY